MIRGSNPGTGKLFVPERPDPPRLLLKGHRDFFVFHGSKAAVVEIITDLHLVPRARMSGAIPLLHTVMQWTDTISILNIFHAFRPGCSLATVPADLTETSQ